MAWYWQILTRVPSLFHVLYYSDGFQRITTGNERSSYFHPLFLRHRLFLCERMMRTRIKGTGTKAAMNPETEPDFNTMPPIKPLDQTPLNKPTGETTTWFFTQSLKKQRQEKEKPPKPTLKHRSVSMGEEPMTTSTVQSFEPPVVPSKLPTTEQFISEKPKSSVLYNPEKEEEITFSLSRPPSYPKILPLVMPILPISCPSTVTPPQTPELPPPVPEMPDDWLLSDTGPLDEPISFEGKTFHYLDACSFDCLTEDRGNDQPSQGFNRRKQMTFLLACGNHNAVEQDPSPRNTHGSILVQWAIKWQPSKWGIIHDRLDVIRCKEKGIQRMA